MKVAVSIGRYKDIGGNPIRNFEVEQKVIKRTQERGLSKGLSPVFIREVFQMLMAESVNIQRSNVVEFKELIFEPILQQKIPLKVSPSIAFQGELGAYSHLCLNEHYPQANAIPCIDFETTFDNLLNGKTDYALVPVENSLVGPIAPVFSLLERQPIQILNEIVFRIDHMLIGWGSFNDIEEVISHPEALKQCSKFINNNKMVSREVNDTAGAVNYLQKNPKIKHIGAIASKQAAEIYQVPLIRKHIQDKKENYTRFVLIKK